MSRTDPEIEALAQKRLAAEESRITGPRRTQVTLGTTFREFWRHPSPWMISATLVGALTWRIAEGDWRLTDLWAPAALVAFFPVLEWLIHVFILHWRPRKVVGVRIDTELARDHRRHHADPRDIPLIFIPWQALIWVMVGTVAIGVFAFPRLGLGLTYVVLASGIGLVYEWIHDLVHTDYRPKTRLYRAVWTNHRMHHYKNEHYWFTVTTSGTADRLLGTYPDPATVETSPTARSLHGISG